MSKPEPKLEPLACCPFCRGPADANGHDWHWYVRCRSRECWAGVHGRLWETAEDAIAAWNTRTPASDVRRQALEEAAKAIERKHTNNVGMVHPMAASDAAAIRALAQPAEETKP